LKIASSIEGAQGEFKIGVRNGVPILVSILNKGLATITEEEKAKIRGQWVTLELDIEKETPLWVKLSALFGTLILIISAGFIIVLLKQISAVKKAKALLIDSENKLQVLNSDLDNKVKERTKN